MNKIISLLLLSAFLLVGLLGCEDQVEYDADGNTVIRKELVLITPKFMDGNDANRIHVYCIDNIMYMDSLGVKIDPDTMKPQRCSTKPQIIPKGKYNDYTPEDMKAELDKLKKELEKKND